MAKRKTHDWELIEREFRSGQFSIREIAKQHCLSDTAIRKKMKKLGVDRDLSALVAEKVRTELVRTEVRTEVRTATPETEQEIIDTAAARTVEVVRSHRVRIRSGSIVVEKLFDQLGEVTDNREKIEAEIDTETEDDVVSNRRDMMLRAVSLQANASTAVSLSAALKNLIGLDREAFNLNDSKPIDQKDSSLKYKCHPDIQDMLDNPDDYTPEVDE